ncbi:MAG: MmgE/PrpD family protein [Deltaproteobacteria bacterium]|nr:MmgE/PrpD family protein [Candidatus Zymogenaceae bacterium]
MEYSKILSDFCHDLTYDKLPADVVEKAKICILDYVANVYGSLQLDAVSRIASAVKSLAGPGPVTCLGFGFSAPILEAVFLNGVTAEAIEAQDGLRFGGNHPGTAVIPAALGLAEKNGKGGKDIIAAVVAGYEAADRAAASVHPRHTLSGFLPTGTTGTFGAAIAAAKLMGLEKTATLSALGCAGYVLPLSMAEQLMGGFTVKVVQGGKAAQGGILAAVLAASGVTGMPNVFEGSKLNGGFCKITTDQPAALERITDALGERLSILDIYFKPYTACRHTHGSAQAAIGLVTENKFGPKDVQKVEVFTYGIAVIAVGKEVKLNDSFVNAQFSIPYVVSAAVADGMLGPAQLTEKRLSDPELIEFTKKVTVNYDDELNKLYPDKTASRVEITLKGGEVLTKQVDIPAGDPRDPLTAEDVAKKVRAFAANRDEKKLNAVIDGILNLETVTDIGEITKII